MNRLLTPGVFEQAFAVFIQKAKLPINQAKTLMDVSLYDMRVIAGATSVDFFQGNINADFTNLNNYVRPDTEHIMILAIRVFTGNDGTINDTDWETGSTNENTKNSDITITVNNVTELQDFNLSEAINEVTTFDRGLIPLSQPILWPGQTELELRWEGKTSVVPPADENLKFHLLGIGYQ